jgi:hypothetical protein
LPQRQPHFVAELPQGNQRILLVSFQRVVLHGQSTFNSNGT